MLRRRERGQVIVFAAGLLPVLLGMAGMAVDVGSYASDRRQLQNAADAIALAAAQELPDVSDTHAAADDWALKNNIDPGLIQVIVTGGNSAPAVQVIISRDHEFAFVRAVGINEKVVGARATAVKVSLGGSDGVVPWAVENNVAGSVPLGEDIVLKYDANNPQTGNFGPIRIDGSNLGTYQDAVTFGSASTICSQGSPDCFVDACPGTYPDTCVEDADQCDGPDCTPKTGNMTGPTRVAVDHRMTYTSAACDTFEETFSAPDSEGVQELNPDCNPWSDGPGHCDSPTELCSRRVFIIPVIDDYPNGSSQPVTVLRFALVYLEGYLGGQCIGSSCQIHVRFVKADLTTGGLSGVYDEDALVHFIRLTE
jgi:putative Flp pilus-assembly TadE/G-like protein